MKSWQEKKKELKSIDIDRADSFDLSNGLIAATESLRCKGLVSQVVSSE